MFDEPFLVTLAILALIFTYCGLIGGAPERWGILILAASFVVQFAGTLLFPQVFREVDLIGVITDLFYFINFGALALYARRVWPIWAASLQILSLSAHFARAFDMGLSPMAYGIMRAIPTYIALLGMMVGATAHRRILRRRGTDPSWKAW